MNLPEKNLTDLLSTYQVMEDTRRTEEQKNQSKALEEYLKKEREFRLYGRPM